MRKRDLDFKNEWYSNGYLMIQLDDTGEFIETNQSQKVSKVRYDNEGNPYFVSFGVKHMIWDFMFVGNIN